jgi:subtilase family serine protease
MLLSSLNRLARGSVRSPSRRRANRNLPDGRTRLHLEALETRALLSLGLPGFAVPDYIALPRNNVLTPLPSEFGYQPSQLAQAYGFNQINFNNNEPLGSGTTIAIEDTFDDPNIVNDLKVFNTQFNLPQLTASTSPGAGGVPTITVMNQNGEATSQTGGMGTPPPTDSSGGWEEEETLDVEWAHAMAPGANIVLVESDDILSAALTGVQTANSLGADVVSMSWGEPEMSN